MLTHQQAEALLLRYFEAETTLAEEEELRAYFRAGEVAPHLAQLDPMFGYWDAASRITAPPPRRRVVRQRRSPARWGMAAAAAILLLVLAGSWLRQSPGISGAFPVAEARLATIDWSEHEVTDPHEAYRLLRGALKTASSQMNRSTRLTVAGVNELDKVFQ